MLSVHSKTSFPFSFSSFGLASDLCRGIETLGFQNPTPIQETAIPPAMAGKDVLACAMTGSGKTAAFLLPIMHRILEAKKRGKDGITRALILTPTRELAAQIRDHLAELARYTTIRGSAIFGGVGMEPQKMAFIRGVDIIIATPGRLLDHFSYPYAKLSNLEFLVLDEADRMLDMGFLPDIRRVLKHLPKTPRQTLFFSATMPEPIVELTKEMLHQPVALNIERPSAPADGITQTAYPVPETLKSRLLLKIIQKGEIRNALAFTRTKHRANRLTEFLSKNGIQCACIHGNRSQSQRTAALADFKSGKCQVLVATDIAARGIDIEALSHVINFDVPHIAEDYIHRVGRTARAKMVGDAFTFVAPAEEYDFKNIERQIKKTIPRLKVEGFDYQERVTEQLEIPLAQRLAAHRARNRRPRPAQASTSAAPRSHSTPRPASGTVIHVSVQPKKPAATTHRGSGERAPQKNPRPRNMDSVFSRYFSD